MRARGNPRLSPITAAEAIGKFMIHPARLNDPQIRICVRAECNARFLSATRARGPREIARCERDSHADI